jgi:mannose-6-phosphate isomerase-like protein (cupin superfamily)
VSVRTGATMGGMYLTRRAFTAALLAAHPAAALPQPQADDPAARVWRPESIRWQPDDPPGAKYAVLDGDRDRPGTLFTYAFWLPGGVWAPVHRHSQAAHVAVMQGALRLGFGTIADRTKTVTVRAGEFFIVRAGEAHFEGSDEPCLIIGTALGGWTTTTLG